MNQLNYINQFMRALIALATLLGAGCAYDTNLTSTAPRSSVGTHINNDDELQFDDDSNKDHRKKDREDEDERDEDEDERDEDERDDDTSLGTNTQDLDDDEDDSEVVYPEFSFSSKGHTTYKNDNLPMTARIETKIDENTLRLSKTQVQISCGSLNGCQQDDVNKSAVSLNGTDQYRRTSKSERASLGEKYNHNFSILADSVTDRKGRVFKFSKPLPVYPWPGKISRYEPLEDGSLTYTADVEISEAVANGIDPDVFEHAKEVFENQGKATRRLQVSITVSLENIYADGTVELRYSTTIHNDKQRMAYGVFPIAKDMLYHIDSDNNLISSIQTNSWHYGSKSKQGEQNVARVELCEKTVNNKSKSFDCAQ